MSEDTFYCPDRVGLCDLPAEAGDAQHTAVPNASGARAALEPGATCQPFFQLLTKQDTGEKQAKGRNVLEGTLVFSFKSEV